MTAFAPGALAPVVPPASPDGQHLVLLAALASVADRRHDQCHGFDACDHPDDFCRSILHDLDQKVRLPTAKATLRATAVQYVREERVRVRAAEYTGGDSPPSRVLAKVLRPAECRAGQSAEVTVRYTGGIWDCTEHPGAGECACRLAVQLATGYGHLGGAWQA